MKKLIFLILLIGISIPTFAQQHGEDLIVNSNDLPKELLDKIKAQKELDKIDLDVAKYGKYAGMGKEIGVAINDGLSAVKDVSLEFADSDLGKFTMAMIAWKVIGKDLIRIVVGLGILIVCISLIWKSYKLRCAPKKVYENGRQPFLMRPFKSSGPYTFENASQYNEAGAWHMIMLIASIIGSAIIMFV